MNHWFVTPHTSHLTPHTSHLTPLFRWMHAADHTSFDFPPHIDESQLTNLTKLPSSLVLPARIAEAAMQLECVVKHIHIAADTATKTPKVGELVIIIPRIGIIYE